MQHIHAIRKTKSSKREAALELPSERTFVCTATANIWSELALNLCSQPREASTSRVGPPRPALASVSQRWPALLSKATDPCSVQHNLNMLG